MFNLFTREKSGDISLLNTATRSKERFQSLKKNEVRMYACGPTVYDHIHIGNLRAYLLPDLLHRLFLVHGYTVKLTINVTDFGHLTDDGDAGEDKIMNGMKREGYDITLQNMRTFTEPYIASFKADLETFGNLTPTTLSRASDYVSQEIALIETLVQKGYAYETSDGVYFDISKFPTYGVLGDINLNALKSGARVDANPEKRNPADFALWKKGNLGWNSRWGLGFPGWHIECTAMAFATLGKQIDIHTGGEDLMYTHHNGEIAQAEALTKKTFARYWLHNAHVAIHDEKFSKSKGNGIQLKELIAQGFSPRAYRYWLLTSHYRSPVNFTYEALKGASQALNRLQRFVYDECANVRPTQADEAYETRFLCAMGNDLDTPSALAIVWELLKDEHISKESKLATIQQFDALLGLGLSLSVTEGQAGLGRIPIATLPKVVKKLIEDREQARMEKNWKEADIIRDKLATHGYLIEDTAQGPVVTAK